MPAHCGEPALVPPKRKVTAVVFAGKPLSTRPTPQLDDNATIKLPRYRPHQARREYHLGTPKGADRRARVDLAVATAARARAYRSFHSFSD